MTSMLLLEAAIPIQHNIGLVVLIANYGVLTIFPDEGGRDEPRCGRDIGRRPGQGDQE